MKKASILLSAFSLFLVPASGTAQGVFPDTIWTPVIFYDYHADSTNPDFRACASGLTRGMVDTVLDRDRKPLPIPSVCSTACASHLSEWFRVSGTGGPDTTPHFMCDSTASSLKDRWYWTSLKPYKGRSGEYTGSNYDSSHVMRNVIIYDSLPFVHQGSGVYEYSNNEFFKLDSRGYGTEPVGSGRNNGFAMDLHTAFTYKKSIVYNFGGAGDLWVFINGRLVVDNGGAHGAMNSAVKLDSVAAGLGLVEGGTYPLDVFYAQRTADSSGIRITFTLVSIPPRFRIIRTGVFPSDTMLAGDTVGIYMEITDERGMRIPSFCNWTIDPATRRAGDTLLIPQGDTTKFTSRFSYRKVGIVGTLRFANVEMTDTAWVFILPAPVPPRLVIEPKVPVPLPWPNELDTLHITASAPSASVYATLRDVFGNFVRYGNISHWVSLDTSIVTVRKGDTLFGEGIVTRNPAALGSIAKVYAVDANSGARDTFVVNLFCSCPYYRMRIMTGNTLAPDTLYMNLNQDTTLSVQVQRPTDSVWIDVSATWQNSANLKIEPPAPTGNSWRFSSSDTGSGWIRVTHNYLLTNPDSVFVIFTKGPSAISGNSARINPGRFSIATSAGFARVHIPQSGTHLITVYSLSGVVISSLRTSANDARIRLPKGVFIVTVRTIGSQERFTTRILNQ